VGCSIDDTADEVSVTTSDDDASGTADDAASDDIIEESIAEEDIEESIAEDSIEDIDDSMDEDGSDDEEASWANTGNARTAAMAVVARRVRIIVGSLGSTLVGQPRGAVPGWVQAPRGFVAQRG
jgi:hypothetical protein